ncbi:hypothetical protein BG015_008222 [Linnemannia schmuckeri]|uniref:Uncharacterized protein n=1 Tax=Linnemannia schmuckeri TaxID=64567 RepID=A0A9P5RZY2_9FUNG|nr:hypothetical protein BG015_008222 [Linnemannia schmuckeri]
MSGATAIPTNISATTKALAVPEVLSYVLIAAGKRYLPKFRLVSHSFLQACVPFFFIRIPDHYFYSRRALSSDHLNIIHNAGQLLRSLGLVNEDFASFDAFASSLRLQSLRLAFNNPTPTALPTNRVFGPLFREGATLGAHLTELSINVWGDSFKGSMDEWNAHVSPRCLLDPKSGLDSPLGLVLSRLLTLEFVNAYEQNPRPMLWATMVDILQNVCPKLTKLNVRRIPLEFKLNDAAPSVFLLPFTATLPPLQDFPPPDVFPGITTLLLDTTSLTIQELIQLNSIFPSVECVSIHIKNNDRPLPPIDPTVVLSFKTVTLTCVDSNGIVALLPILPHMTSLSLERYSGEFNMRSMVLAFKSIGGRNRFKLLAFPFPWAAASLRDFMQLECFRSLESLELWNSSEAFLKAIDTEESSESQAGSELSTAPPAIITAISPSTTAVTTTGTEVPVAEQKQALPVFLDTIRVLRLKTYISRRSIKLTTTQTSILNVLLKKMPCLEHFSLQRELLPDLSVFDGLARNQPPLRYLSIAIAASTGFLTPEMVSTQILDRYVPDMENMHLSLEGPRAIMERPWVKELSRWFDGESDRRSEYDPVGIYLSMCYWG